MPQPNNWLLPGISAGLFAGGPKSALISAALAGAFSYFVGVPEVTAATCSPSKVRRPCLLSEWVSIRLVGTSELHI